MEPFRFDMGCSGPLCPFGPVCAPVQPTGQWRLLAEQERTTEQIVHLPVPRAVTEILEVVENILQERISERIPKQTVSVPARRVKLAGSSGEAGSSWPGVNDTTSVATAALAKSVGEA